MASLPLVAALRQKRGQTYWMASPITWRQIPLLVEDTPPTNEGGRRRRFRPSRNKGYVDDQKGRRRGRENGNDELERRIGTTNLNDEKMPAKPKRERNFGQTAAGGRMWSERIRPTGVECFCR